MEKFAAGMNQMSSPQLVASLTDTCHLTKDLNEQIADAIENKYDSLKDKLLLDALMKQVCDRCFTTYLSARSGFSIGLPQGWLSE